jgi:hypothetical protein
MVDSTNTINTLNAQVAKGYKNPFKIALGKSFMKV